MLRIAPCPATIWTFAGGTTHRIAVVNMKGGVDKTTTAVHINVRAFGAARRAVVEADAARDAAVDTEEAVKA